MLYPIIKTGKPGDDYEKISFENPSIYVSRLEDKRLYIALGQGKLSCSVFIDKKLAIKLTKWLEERY